MKALKTTWGFDCDCTLCTASAEEVRQSDARIDQIKEIQSELEDYSEESDASPALAETNIALIRKDNLWLRMHDAYVKAAVEYAGVGDERSAIKYAEKALGFGFTCRGPPRIVYDDDRDTYGYMEALRTDPHHHDSWLFRAQ